MSGKSAHNSSTVDNSSATVSSFNMMNASVWDPTAVDPAGNNNYPTAEAKRRVHAEVREYYRASPEGIHLMPDDGDVSKFHAIIVGPPGTPYEGGFFYFFLAIPPNYPWSPPKVKLMTTGDGSVRFNPNLYANGRVCLSILGTWMGPSWSPSMTLQSVLLSIQSLLNEAPYFNEPGYEGRQHEPAQKRRSEAYNKDVRYNTMAVAVLDMIEGTSGDSCQLPQILKNKMVALFTQNFSTYHTLISKDLSSRKHDYAKLLKRLIEAKKKMATTLAATEIEASLQ